MSPSEPIPALVLSWRHLRARDLPTIVRIGVLWPLASGLKRTLSLPRLARFFDAAPRTGGVDPARTAWLVDGVLRRAYRHTPGYCVERSLILFRLLRRGGHPVHLCFGVQKKPSGALGGHAWLLLGGVPVAEARDPRELYVTTYTYPPVP